MHEDQRKIEELEAKVQDAIAKLKHEYPKLLPRLEKMEDKAIWDIACLMANMERAMIAKLEYERLFQISD